MKEIADITIKNTTDVSPASRVKTMTIPSFNRDPHSYHRDYTYNNPYRRNEEHPGKPMDFPDTHNHYRSGLGPDRHNSSRFQFIPELIEVEDDSTENMPPDNSNNIAIYQPVSLTAEATPEQLKIKHESTENVPEDESSNKTLEPALPILDAVSESPVPADITPDL
ncbi:hypothetical protein B7463_g684, partial [Scytalidium lignicola]